MFDYRSPLFHTIIYDRLACVKLLIEHGANTDKLRWEKSSWINITDKPSVTDNYFSSLSNDHEHKNKNVWDAFTCCTRYGNVFIIFFILLLNKIHAN